MQDKINNRRLGGKGYLGNEVEKYRVPANEMIFSTSELLQLYDTCDMDSITHQIKPVFAHKQHQGSYCKAKKVSLQQAQRECRKASGTPLFDTCLIEYCANGGQAVELIDAENDFQ